MEQTIQDLRVTLLRTAALLARRDQTDGIQQRHIREARQLLAPAPRRRKLRNLVARITQLLGSAMLGGIISVALASPGRSIAFDQFVLALVGFALILVPDAFSLND